MNERKPSRAPAKPSGVRRRKPASEVAAEPVLQIAGTQVPLNPGQFELIKSLASEFARRVDPPVLDAQGELCVAMELPGLEAFWLHQLETLAIRQAALEGLFEAS